MGPTSNIVLLNSNFRWGGPSEAALCWLAGASCGPGGQASLAHKERLASGKIDI